MDRTKKINIRFFIIFYFYFFTSFFYFFFSLEVRLSTKPFLYPSLRFPEYSRKTVKFGTFLQLVRFIFYILCFIFLQISQNLHQNTCARGSFIIELQTSASNFIKKKRPWLRCIPANFIKFLRISFLQHTSMRML